MITSTPMTALRRHFCSRRERRRFDEEGITAPFSLEERREAAEPAAVYQIAKIRATACSPACHTLEQQSM
jgi:hypothetical protein